MIRLLAAMLCVGLLPGCGTLRREVVLEPADAAALHDLDWTVEREPSAWLGEGSAAKESDAEPVLPEEPAP